MVFDVLQKTCKLSNRMATNKHNPHHILLSIKSIKDNNFVCMCLFTNQKNIKMFLQFLFFHFSCQKTQSVLDDCMLKKLNIERPYIGYFTEIRVHKTDRPRPGPYLPRKEYKDDRPFLPADYPREESRHGFSKFGF